jgi:hypothetical protein
MTNQLSEASIVCKKASFWPFILCAIALLPAVYLGWLISATAVNILYADDSAFIFLFQHLAAHTLTFGDFLAQHNESRSVFPLLLMVGVGSITHWDVRYDMWIEFAATCVVSLNIFLLSRRVMRMNLGQCLLLWIPANLVLFSTAQSQNWTWGIQMIVVMPMLCISTATLIAYTNVGVTWKFALGILLATISTYSYAIGQIAWLILPAPLIAGSLSQTRRFSRQLWLWAAACAVNMVVYYRGYYKPPWHPSLLLSLKHPIAAAEYFAAFLGAALAQGYQQLWASVVFGIVLLGCLFRACVFLWRIRHRQEVFEPGAAWLVLCAYTLASACTTTAGRLGFGVLHSQDSRYTGFSVYLVIGLVYLGAMIVREFYRRDEFAFAKIMAVLGIALIVIPWITTQIGGTRQMWEDRHVRLQGKAVTQLLNIFPNPLGIYTPPKIRGQKDFLDRMRILSPGLVKSRDLTRIAGASGATSFGHVDGISEVNGGWLITGWAIVPYRHDAAEVVLLAGDYGAGASTAFIETLVGEDRPDVAAELHHRAYAKSGWKVSVNLADLPSGTKTVSAWEYDPQTGVAHRLAGTGQITGGGLQLLPPY